MKKRAKEHATQKTGEKRPHPPGRIKIARAMRSLLETKDFNSITTAEIARESGVNEALIYRYFNGKRGLLHQVLAEDLEKFNARINSDIKGIRGALNKLRKLIWSQIDYYNNHRIPARILMLEVRSYPGYFESETHRMVKEYAKLLSDIIEEGVRNGEIRNDISLNHIKRVIIGGIEYLSLPGVIYHYEINADVLQEDLCEILFDGIANKAAGDGKML